MIQYSIRRPKPATWRKRRRGASSTSSEAILGGRSCIVVSPRFGIDLLSASKSPFKHANEVEIFVYRHKAADWMHNLVAHTIQVAKVLAKLLTIRGVVRKQIAKKRPSSFHDLVQIQQI